MIPPALVGLKPSKVNTFVRVPIGRRSRILPAAFLGEVGNGIGGIVCSHAGDDVGHLGIGLVPEQPIGEFGVELLEDIGFQLGVGMDDVEDLLALCPGSVFDQVGDLGRLEADNPTEGGPDADAWDMTDQRFEGLPVLAGMAAADDRIKPEQAGRAAGVEAGDDPTLVGRDEARRPMPAPTLLRPHRSVGGPRCPGEAAPRRPSLEAAQINFGLGQRDSALR